MSAWYVFATLGFYPADPFRGSYVLGQPLVASACVSLASGRSLNIGTSMRSTARSRFNDEVIVDRTLPHARLVEGGRLVSGSRTG